MTTPTKSIRFAKTIREAALILKVNRVTLQDWLAEGCPGKTAKGYPIKAIALWRANNKNSAGLPGDAEVGERLKMAQAREREARAELVELQLKIELGEFVSKDG